MKDITSHVRQKSACRSGKNITYPHYITVNKVVLLLLHTESTDYVCTSVGWLLEDTSHISDL